MDALALAGTNDREELQKPLAHPADKTAESSLNGLFLQLSGLCSMAAKPIALMIDEIDSASSHQVFFDFLAQIRGYYLRWDRMPFFHSVILAGV